MIEIFKRLGDLSGLQRPIVLRLFIFLKHVVCFGFSARKRTGCRGGVSWRMAQRNLDNWPMNRLLERKSL